MRLPLQTLPPEHFAEYGKSYYHWGENELEAVTSHAAGQMSHYDRFATYLREAFPSATYRRWLDVGSAGYPTSFEDYEFTTIEPSEAAVAYGQSTWRRDRIHNATIEVFETEQQFDGVVFLNSLYCTPTPVAAIAKAYEILRDSGILIVSIGQCLMETATNTEDGLYSQYEDFWQGATMWVYYNRLNLQALCAHQGFVFRDDLTVDSGGDHPYHEMRYMIFEKRADKVAAAATAPSWEACRRLTDCLLDSLSASFRVRTIEALQKIDKRSTAIAGWPNLIADMEEVRPFTAAEIFVDCASPEGGGRYVSLHNLATAVAERRIDTIAVAAVNKRDDCVQMLQACLNEQGIPVDTVSWLMPNRRSDIGGLLGDVMGKRDFVRAVQFS